MFVCSTKEEFEAVKRVYDITKNTDLKDKNAAESLIQAIAVAFENDDKLFKDNNDSIQNYLNQYLNVSKMIDKQEAALRICEKELTALQHDKTTKNENQLQIEKDITAIQEQINFHQQEIEQLKECKPILLSSIEEDVLLNNPLFPINHVIPNNIDFHIGYGKCLVLIIAIEDYLGNGYCCDLPGSTVDKKNLNETMSALGFDIIQNEERNCTKAHFSDLVDRARQALKQNPDKYEMFAFFYSGHGIGTQCKSEILFSAPGYKMDKVAVNDIKETFSNKFSGLGSGWNGPRYLYFDCCLGGNDVAPQRNKDVARYQFKNTIMADPDGLVHPDENMTVITSNTLGNKSVSHKIYGSILINKVCEQFKSDEREMGQINRNAMQAVNAETRAFQTPLIQTTLFKKVYLNKTEPMIPNDNNDNANNTNNNNKMDYNSDETATSSTSISTDATNSNISIMEPEKTKGIEYKEYNDYNMLCDPENIAYQNNGAINNKISSCILNDITFDLKQSSNYGGLNVISPVIAISSSSKNVNGGDNVYVPNTFTRNENNDNTINRMDAIKNIVSTSCMDRDNASGLHSVNSVNMSTSKKERDNIKKKKLKLKCSYCHRRFEFKSKKERHERTHTKDKPFKCDECGKAFTQKGDLIRHKRTHSGEKPFQCNLCGRGWTRKRKLTKHSCNGRH